MEHNENEKMSLPRAFGKTEHLIHRYMAARMGDDFDPERGQGRILALLKRTGPLSQREMTFLLGIRPQSLGELLRKLEEGGFISREPLAEDKRGRLVSLTDKGAAVEMPRSPMDEVFSCLSGEEQEQLSACLEKICENLESKLPDEEPGGERFGMRGPGCGHGHRPGGCGHGHGPHRHGQDSCGFHMRGWLALPDFFRCQE